VRPRCHPARRISNHVLIQRFLSSADTAEGFTVAQIEANPPAFFADTHTAEFTAGAIRGQIELVESSY
jgi:hypothetical protein